MRRYFRAIKPWTILRNGVLLVSLLFIAFGVTLKRTIQEPLNGSSGFQFVDGKSVVLVSHELSLSGGPLLLMELGSILQRSGAHVVWVTANKKEITGSDPVVVSLEKKLLNHGLQILPARGTRTVAALIASDLVILNTAVVGKWIDAILKEGEVKSKVLAKTLWWIHEMRGHYFAMEYVRHLPEVAGVMIDSHAAAEYWQTRTRERLRFAY